MRIEPTHDNVAVKVDENPTTTKSGLALPQNMADDHTLKTGIVIAVGPGRKDLFVRATNGSAEEIFCQPPCKVGDRVLLSSYTSREFIPCAEGEKVVVVSSSNILAILKE